MASRKIEREIDRQAEREGLAISRLRELVSPARRVGRQQPSFVHGRSIRQRGALANRPPGRGGPAGALEGVHGPLAV
jgi:hypothetical protein